MNLPPAIDAVEVAARLFWICSCVADLTLELSFIDIISTGSGFGLIEHSINDSAKGGRIFFAFLAQMRSLDRVSVSEFGGEADKYFAC